MFTQPGKIPSTKNAKVPILTYHSIDRSGSVVSTTPETFRRQVRFLSIEGYTAMTLAELSSRLARREEMPAKPIVLTFDDGFHNFYTEAFSVLQECGFTATVFLVTDFCEGFNDWPGNPPELPRSKLLSWSEVREMAKYGIELGSHTLSHPDLTKLSDRDAAIEIMDSRKRIEDEVGGKVESFAYPFGKFTAQIVDAVRNDYSTAVSTKMGKVTAGSDLFRLERIDAYYMLNPHVFHRLQTSAMDRYLALRQSMRRVKAAVLGT